MTAPDLAGAHPRTLIKGIHTVGVPVADQRISLRFFVEALGLELRLRVDLDETTSWIEVAPPGSGTTIALVGATADMPSGVDTGVRFSVEDAQRAHTELAAGGVRLSELERADVVAPPMFSVIDPDANRFYVVEERRRP